MIFRSLNVLVVAVLAMSAGGCGKLSEPEPFKLVSVQSGDTYRINGVTGTLHRIVDSTMVRVIDVDRVQLQVGSIYVFENGSPMKYLGEGRFEAFRSNAITVDEFLKQETGKK